MGLATIIRKQKLKDKQFRILVLGLDNAGKSTVVARWLQKDITGIPPTFGFNIHDLSVGQQTAIVWDMGGQECLRAFWRSYYEGETDGVCFVVDGAATERFSKVKEELIKVLTSAGDERAGAMGASVLVLVNKQDQCDALSAEKVSDMLGLSYFSRSEHEINVLSCSAWTDPDSCMAGLRWLVNSVNERRYS